MFDNLSSKIQDAFKKLTGKGKLSEKDIDEALKEIRMALFEADVNFKVVRSFLADVKERATGSGVYTSLTPGQTMIKVVADAMSDLLGTTSKDITYSGTSPTVVLMAGVQGSGKTTSAAKLALFLRKKNRNVMVAACDTHRAAAVAQLKTLCASVSIPVYSREGETATRIAEGALREAKLQGCDVLIVDTAGRQHVDGEMMDEIVEIRQAVNPTEVLFVVDCMMGQLAVDAALAFDEKLSITGFILSKADSDARGGAALSVCYITGKPVKFAGTGEKLSEFELFHPDRVAGRILGMGDMLSLIEKIQSNTTQEESEKAAEKLMKNSFTLQDYLDQIEQVAQMGGLSEMMKSIPGMSKQLNGAEADESALKHSKAIIQSMTVKERNNPSIINASRRRRIAAGSGTTVTDVNRLLKGFDSSKKLIKQLMSQKRRPGSMPKLPFM